MLDYRSPWKTQIAGALNTLLQEAGLPATVEPAQIIVELPPKPELGDLGFPMFGYAKLLRKGPPQIAQALAAALGAQDLPGSFTAEGPYLNLRLNRADVAAQVLSAVLEAPAPGNPVSGNPAPPGKPGPAGDTGPVPGAAFPFGRPGTLTHSRVMVEFSSPNTNKPLHLGHLRNDVLGESISRILAACGADVRNVCIINDRGIH
ncbi:MAG: arginine--tRNA ligase, partial [Treponema sp.]|nr:arginine--tRNA ligase [Treponema sp.]